MKFQDFLTKRLCRICRHRNAKFTFRGHVKRDRQHDICHKCYRGLRDRNVARQLSGTINPQLLSLEMSSYFYRQTLEQPGTRAVRRPTVA